MSDVIEEFRAIVGAEHVLVDSDLRAAFERDWTGRYGGEALAVVRPGNTAEVAAVARCCTRNAIGIVTQGGNTGLVGGGVPSRPGQVVVSTRRLDAIGPVDEAARQITVGAGVTIANWRRAAVAAGLDIPIDFGARESATIGGAISTNAGGSRVVRFGTMRHQVVGIEAVLADGSVVGSLAGLPKESAGLHWPSLLAGAEGTFGIVTAARVRLVPAFAHMSTALVATASLGDAIDLLVRCRARTDSLDGIEVLLPPALDLAARHLGRQPPIELSEAGCAVLIDLAAHTPTIDELAGILDDAPGVVDCAIAQDAGGRAALTAFRDRVTDAIATESTSVGIPAFKLDVAVPVIELPRLLDVAERAADDDGCRLIAFGHLAEGNIHLNYVGATATAAIADRVLAAVATLGGTISAEHGIGRAKAPWLHLVRSAAELEAQRAVKAALDPTGTFNAGVLVD